MTHDSGSASVISASRFLLRHKSQFITKNVNCPTQRGWQLTFLLCVAISFSNVLHQFRTTDSRTTNQPRFPIVFLTSNTTLLNPVVKTQENFRNCKSRIALFADLIIKKLQKRKHIRSHTDQLYSNTLSTQSQSEPRFSWKILRIFFRKTFAESRFCFIFALAKQKEHSSIAQLVRAPDC